MQDDQGTTTSRLLRLEREGARDSQRLAELERRVDALTPLLTSVVTLTVEFKNMREDLSSFMRRVEKRDQERAERDADESRERTIGRRWQIGLAVSLVLALVTSLTIILSAHP